MESPLHPSVGPALSFNGGFVDTLGFLALQGLFTAHVTGNFVTLGVSIVHGTSGALPKLIALPVFVLVVGLTHLAAVAIHRRGWVPLRLLLIAHTLMLAAFALLAIVWGPFTDGDSATALVTGMAGVTAMAIQNAISRQHMKGTPPTTLMTGNVTQFAVDVFALWTEHDDAQRLVIKQRLKPICTTLLGFAFGCIGAALLYLACGLWALILPVLVATGVCLRVYRSDRRQPQA
ncbi:membrane protein [Pseudomonas sp. Ost2]|uniref:YoaK family protein n=1 Tax=Pseudomonas sp. Ost2 TaxID=2678260 RepID=UPI001BB4034B|nr:YoaK family protein [Pseudomonas sp. Ost2]BBP77468.1 membrane protein [Pseudomonas sp. Ost2]